MKQHSPRFLHHVNDAKSKINEISPQVLHDWMEQHKSFICIDVRDKDELVDGKIPGSIHLSKGVIERDIEKTVPDEKSCVVVYCSGGFRCALVAKSLQEMGYKSVYSLDTGFSGWKALGLATE